MTVDTLIREGRLSDALAEQTELVKRFPGDPDQRYVLFCLLAFAGELERALLQLDALSHGDEKLGFGSVVYRNLITSEEERRRAYEERAEPVLPPDASPWLAERLAAFRCALAGEAEAAEERLEAIADDGALLEGERSGRPFTAIRDVDDLLGPVLEVFAGGRYLWMPFESIRSLTVSQPQALVDLLWVPAKLEDRHGEVAEVHLPVRYFGSHAASEEPLRLGNATSYEAVTPALSRGVGQKMLWTVGKEEIEETPLLELSTVEIGAD